MKIRMLLSWAALAALLSAGAALAADKWRINDFGTRDPDKLLLFSWDTPSMGLKYRIRSYLAEQRADSPQGLFTQAWLQDKIKDGSGIPGYEACVAKYPKYAFCLYNLAASYTNAKRFEDALRLRQRILDMDPGFNDCNVVYHAFTTLRDNLKRPDEAAALLARYQEKLGDSYIWDYIAAQDARKTKNLGLTLEKLEAAAHKHDAPYDVWEEMADLKSGDLYDSRSGETRLGSAVNVMFDYIHAGHRDPRTIAYLRDNFKDALAGSGDRQKLIDLEKQFSRVLAPEFIEYAYDNAHDFSVGAAWVNANLPKPEGNEVPYELFAWADANAHIEGLTPRVLSAYQRSIANAYTDKQRRDRYGLMLRMNAERGWCSQMASLAGNLEARFPGLKSPENAFEVAICNQDPTAAVRYLEQYENQSGPTYRADWGRVARLRAAEQNRAQYERENPFLQNWFKQFGDRLELRIEFATAASDLPATAQADLNKLANLLKAPGAAGYVFEISGHTDNRGSAAMNETLSGARAAAVVAALVKKEVPEDRLRSKGYGLTLPLASNQNDSGRARNRRVEVRPVGTLSAPILAQKGNLPSGKLLPLPGGRWAVLGEGPSYLWDLHRNVRLTEYAEGSPLFVTPNGRYLVARSEQKLANQAKNTELLTYDLKSGRLIARAALPFSWGFALSPKGDELAASNIENIMVLAVPGLTTARMAPVAGKGCYSKGMAWLAGDQIALSCASYEHIHVVNARTLAPVASLDGVDWVHSLAATGDGRYLVAGHNGGKLMAWDAKTWKLHGEMEVPHGVPSKLAARPDSSEMAVSGNGNATQRIDIESMTVLDTWERNAQPVYSADGGKLYQANYPGYEIRDLADNSVAKLEPEKDASSGASTVWVFPGSNRMFVATASSAEIFDMTTFTRIYDLTPISTSWKRIGADTLISTHYSEGTWHRFDVANLKLSGENAMPEKELLKKYPDIWGEKFVVVDPHDRSAGKAERRAGLQLINRAGGGKRQVDVELVTGELRLGVYDTSTNMALSPGDRWLVILPSWQDGYGTEWVTSKKAYLVDTASGQVVRTFAFTIPPKRFEFTGPDTVEFQFGGNGLVYTLPDGSETKTPYGTETRVALGGDREGVYQANGNLYVMQGGKLATVVDLQNRMLSAGYLPGPNLLAALMSNGTVQIHDGSSFALKFTLMPKGKGEWIAYTPDGYFASSLNGTEGLSWNVGEDYLPFSALREKFEKPELIRQALAPARNDTPAPPPVVDKQVGNLTNPDSAKPVQFDADAFSPPYDIRIDGAEERQTAAESEAVTVLVERKRTSAEPYQLRFTVNGRELKGAVGARGLKKVSACASASGACTEKHVFSADLVPGNNIIQVSLGYKGMWLNPQTVIVQRQATKAADKPLAMLPRLWFFAVGVSDYAKPDLSLKYPHADAQALADLLRAQKGRLYSEVNTKVLTNAEATTQKLTVEMNRFLKGASQQDLIVLFFAGHGILDNDQTLYFVSYDANPEEPYTGLNVSSIQELLNKRPQSQKALLWLDICHSGAAGETTRAASIGSDEAIKLLAQGTGVKVMTSSTGREYSLEGPDYLNGHGAFTAALLEGLNGQADKKVGDGDGYVSVLELETYVARRVPEITKGKQHPTTAYSSKFQDYPVMRGQ